MKETLQLHKLIANRPFPVMHLWSSLSSVLMKGMELAGPGSLPSKTDYQTFAIPSLPSETLSPERIEEDPEDNIELCNKLSILNTLEARIQALDSPDEEDQGDQSTSDAAVPVMTKGSSQESAGPSHDSSGNVVHSDDKLLTQYWKENPRPISLPPIGTIIETIDNLDSTTELQKPTHIWQEFVKLETEPNLGDVHPHFIPIQG